ncbi:HK97 family phage prohead protease [Bradyrhizobium japonicum]|uniref:HK97 family phage prohead protease n=1 Tax=Bradyrhizobium japonicum TaxID=375 RepID=UPI00200CC1A0|nr:HK97 family phage prohead protease [Bradyrhizobium japonicum]UQD96137.1 HK97 family phage prohead protease [Bradyrhizobium japonicum]
MTLLYKFMPVGISSAEDDTIVDCSTGDTDRAGEIVDQGGIDLTNFKRNPIVLWQHNTGAPIARASEVGVVGGKLRARVTWPPAGVSAKADEIRGLVKAGVISAVSIGFRPKETIALDPANPKWGPQRYVRSELDEFSFVSVPANQNALVVQRALALRGGGNVDDDAGRAKRLRDLELIQLAQPPQTRAERERQMRLLAVSPR